MSIVIVKSTAFAEKIQHDFASYANEITRLLERLEKLNNKDEFRHFVDHYGASVPVYVHKNIDGYSVRIVFIEVQCDVDKYGYYIYDAFRHGPYWDTHFKKSESVVNWYNNTFQGVPPEKEDEIKNLLSIKEQRKPALPDQYLPIFQNKITDASVYNESQLIYESIHWLSSSKSIEEEWNENFEYVNELVQNICIDAEKGDIVSSLGNGNEVRQQKINNKKGFDFSVIYQALSYKDKQYIYLLSVSMFKKGSSVEENSNSQDLQSLQDYIINESEENSIVHFLNRNL